jgi:hypothetical protein
VVTEGGLCEQCRNVERDVTRDDMEAAAERIAARDGVTVEDVRERIRRVDAAERSQRSAQHRERSEADDTTERSAPSPVRERPTPAPAPAPAPNANANAGTERSCGLEGCEETFVPRNARHEYCTQRHRSAAFRARERNER